MRFIDLHIDGFGRFHDFSMTFDPGMNVIYGTNEAGKSTLHTFLQAMLYGFTRARGVEAEHDTMARLTPWENPEVYSGTLRLEADGTIWRIERDFHKSRDSFTLVNETAGTTESAPAAKLQAILGGLSETAYAGTVSIGQLKTASPSGMSGELARYITNMNTSGSMELDISGAMALLEREKDSQTPGTATRCPAASPAASRQSRRSKTIPASGRSWRTAGTRRWPSSRRIISPTLLPSKTAGSG